MPGARAVVMLGITGPARVSTIVMRASRIVIAGAIGSAGLLCWLVIPSSCPVAVDLRLESSDVLKTPAGGHYCVMGLSIRNPDKPGFGKEMEGFYVENGSPPIQAKVGDRWENVEGNLKCTLDPGGRHHDLVAIPSDAER